MGPIPASEARGGKTSGVVPNEGIEGNSELAEIRGARAAARAFPGSGDKIKAQGNQGHEEGDHHEHLGECEAAAAWVPARQAGRVGWAEGSLGKPMEFNPINWFFD